MYDDLPFECFRTIDSYPHLSINVFHPALGHTMFREVQHGEWRNNLTPLMMYSEYLSPDEISKCIDPEDGQLVVWRIPHEEGKRPGSSWDKVLQNLICGAFVVCLKEEAEELKHLQAQHQLREWVWRQRKREQKHRQARRQL